jgi:hypothetical protein
MSPLSPNHSLLKILGPGLLRLRGKPGQFSRDIGQHPEYPRARELRAGELGVHENAVLEARIAFDDHCCNIRKLPAPVKALRRRGLTELDAAAVVSKWVAAAGADGPHLRHHPISGKTLRDVADFMTRILGSRLRERALRRYEKRLEALFPGSRYLRGSGSDQGVCVYFVKDKNSTGGSIEPKRTEEVTRKGRKVQRITSLFCNLLVTEDCGKAIFGPGIEGGGLLPLTVWAAELHGRSIPDGIRAFDAVWVIRRPGYKVGRRAGILLKSARGALEHYEDAQSLDSVLEVRALAAAKRASERPFQLSKARRTVADKLAGRSAEVLFAGEDERNSLKF